MKMLHKITDCESFESSQENVYKRVYPSKIVSLQRTSCTSIISRLHHGFFSENVPKTSCLKSTFFKRFWRNSILIKRDPAVHSLQFYQNQSSR